MSDSRHGSHTTFSIHLHIVWITKYRHKGLRGEVAERVRAMVREACQKSGVDILPGQISPEAAYTHGASWFSLKIDDDEIFPRIEDLAEVIIPVATDTLRDNTAIA
jgi:hypothetical protein